MTSFSNLLILQDAMSVDLTALCLLKTIVVVTALFTLKIVPNQK